MGIFSKKVVSVFAAISLGLLSAACGSSSKTASNSSASTSTTTAGPPVQLKLGIAATVPDLPIFVADAQGMYAKHGLDVSLVSGYNSGPTIAAALVAGQMNVTPFTLGLMVPLINQGESLVAFARFTQTYEFDILVRKGVALPSSSQGWAGVMRDLKGKKVGVVALSSESEYIAKTLYKEAGVDPNGQTYVATGLAPTTLAALANSQVDVAFTLEPALSLALQQGVATEPFSLRASQGPDILKWPEVLLTTTSQFAQQNPTALKRLNAALAEATAFIKNPANQSAVLNVLETDIKLTPAQAQLLYTNDVSNIPDDYTLTPQVMQQLGVAAQWAQQVGLSPKLLPVSSFTVKV